MFQQLMDTLVRGWQSACAAWHERRRRAVASRELRSMDERTLHDIGLSHRAVAEWPNYRYER